MTDLDNHQDEAHPRLTLAPESPPSEAVWTIREAAQRFDVSLSTLKRRIAQDELAGAYQDGSGAWRIPMSALLAAGFTRGQHTRSLTQVTDGNHPQPELDAGESAERSVVDDLHREVDDLRRELDRERAERRHVQALADERDRSIRNLELSLRALTTGPLPSALNGVAPDRGPLAPAVTTSTPIPTSTAAPISAPVSPAEDSSIPKPGWRFWRSSRLR